MLKTIEFYYNQTKKPKLLENDVLVLYTPHKLIFQPGERKVVDMKLKIKLPSTVTGSCRLLFELANRGLYLANSNYLANETDLQLEIVNSNLTQTLQINSKQEIGYFTPHYTAGSKIKYKYVKS